MFHDHVVCNLIGLRSYRSQHELVEVLAEALMVLTTQWCRYTDRSRSLAHELEASHRTSALDQQALKPSWRQFALVYLTHQVLFQMTAGIVALRPHTASRRS